MCNFSNNLLSSLNVLLIGIQEILREFQKQSLVVGFMIQPFFLTKKFPHMKSLLMTSREKKMLWFCTKFQYKLYFSHIKQNFISFSMSCMKAFQATQDLSIRHLLEISLFTRDTREISKLVSDKTQQPLFQKSTLVIASQNRT